MANVLERVLRVGEGRTLRRLQRYAAAVNQLEDDFTELTDDELRNETVELRERYSNGESLDDLLPEAFAAVREAAKRTLVTYDEGRPAGLQSVVLQTNGVFQVGQYTELDFTRREEGSERAG